ncbi:MAG: alpha-L-fucosidase [Oscillospiraceae bacterium]
MDYNISPGPFANTWDSITGQYKCPEWFRDAKFGVWSHWGPQCVPMAGDWYARNMYMEDSSAYKHHLANYGHPSVFGYKDVIELWKAENFDPDALMNLYKGMGARYFVSMGVHHDNFDLWNSRYQSWNAVNKGPKRDIVGEWARAARQQGLRFGVSEHLERSYSWFATNKGRDAKGNLRGVPYDGNDPAYRELYLDNHLEDSNPAYPLNPSPAFVENFYLRIKDLVERYNPDWLYTDGGVPFGETGLAMIANFYNHNLAQRDGKLEAVYSCKDINHVFPDLYHGEYRKNVGILDLERTISGTILDAPWQTDTCIGDWFYTKNCNYKTALTVLQQMMDVVSKNGTFLLSLPLRPDGTHDEEELAIIGQITRWMAVYGEAVYGTRPYSHYGEGPSTNVTADTIQELDCTEEDFRFTKKGNTLYAVCMNAAPGKPLCIQSLNGLREQVEVVDCLGGGEVRWEWRDEALIVRVNPGEQSLPMTVLRLRCKKAFDDCGA